jgi:hypothetical protein
VYFNEQHGGVEMTNIIAIVLFLLAALAAGLGIFGASIDHLEFWTLGFIALGLLANRLGAYDVTKP